MEAVVKVGGSISANPRGLRRLMNSLKGYSGEHAVVVVPGGGVFADAVRSVYLLHRLSEGAAHRMAVLAMDQYGLLLNDIAGGRKATYSWVEVENVAKRGGLPILLPSEMVLEAKALKPSWDVTSDSISAYIAGAKGVKKVILAKDVDGVYNADPKEFPDAQMHTLVESRSILEGKTVGCVDRYLPEMLLRYDVDCYVVNGFHPPRIRAILEGRPEVYTRIVR